MTKVAKIVFQSRELDHMVNSCPTQCILDINLDFYSRKTQKFSAHVARQLAMYTINQLKDARVEVQHDVFDKFIGHSIVKDVVLHYLVDSWVAKHKDDVLQNMKACINTRLACPKASKLVMDKDIMCTLASSQSINNNKALAKLLGVNMWNILKANLKRAQLDTKQDVFWLDYKKTP